MKKPLQISTAFLLLSAASWAGWYWFSTGRYIEKTDNAYVRSEITQISSKVSGYVKGVSVADNMPVKAGDELVRVEDDEFRVRLEFFRKKLEERRAALRVARFRSSLQQSRIESCRAQLAALEAEQVRRGSELRRYSTLFPGGIVSELDYEAVQTTEKKARADTAGARANLESAEKEREVLLAEERRLEAELRQQEEELKLPARELADTVIRSPIAGVVGNRRVRAGQYVKPGSALLSVVPREDIWVEANFKEVQLTRMHEGQVVTLKVDNFPGSTLTGRIESVSQASGAEFSLIPPENASGNFTKIVQRMPVKIRLDRGQSLLGSLRAGMSVVVRVDTKSSVAEKTMARR